jgi:Transposase
VTLVENHWNGIIAGHANHLSNGLLEGINSLVQAAKVHARGYHSKTKMITIIYITAAKAPSTHPHQPHTKQPISQVSAHRHCDHVRREAKPREAGPWRWHTSRATTHRPTWPEPVIRQRNRPVQTGQD